MPHGSALRRALAAAIACWCVGTGSADAQKKPSPAAKPRDCTIDASGIDFGLYDTLNTAPTDATGSVTYSCTQGGGALNVIVTIDRGFAGSFSRQMSNGQDRLSYNVYLDVGHTQIWGDGSNGTLTLQDKIPGNTKPISVTAYGRLFPRQNVGSGRFVDGLVVTMQF